MWKWDRIKLGRCRRWEVGSVDSAVDDGAVTHWSRQQDKIRKNDVGKHVRGSSGDRWDVEGRCAWCRITSGAEMNSLPASSIIFSYLTITEVSDDDKKFSLSEFSNLNFNLI